MNVADIDLNLLVTFVAMMQPAESLMGQDATRGSGTSSTVRRSLPESKMRAVFVVVADMRGRASGQMSEAARFVLTLIRKNDGEWF
jgi:hypothetical protein